MASKKKPTAFVIVLMIASAIVWVIQNRPQDKVGSQGGFEQIVGCSLESHRNNDGDSFHVKMPDGKVEEVRLYYTDAPESAAKKYRDGNTNYERLRYQGEYFGGLSQNETVQVGQEAKAWVKSKLSKKKFTVFTRREVVYNGPRIYALVMVADIGGERWLHELLVEQGLARIYTQGTNLPDGTAAAAQLRKLHGLEQQARKGGRGAWRLAQTPNRKN